MILGLRRQRNSRAARRVSPAARYSRLEVESPERRLVPAGIRNLAGFLTNNLPANDDNSTGAVNLGFNVNFFGVQTTDRRPEPR